MKRILIVCCLIAFMGNCAAEMNTVSTFQLWNGINWNASPEDVKERLNLGEDVELIADDEYVYLLLPPDDQYSNFMTPILGENVVRNTSYIEYNFYGDENNLSLEMVLVVFYADSIPFEKLKELLSDGYTKYYNYQPGRRIESNLEWLEWIPDTYDTDIMAMINSSEKGIAVTYICLPYFYPEYFD